jgi:TetR/AcrR family transcriptional regulator, tetracycline repressor protein
VVDAALRIADSEGLDAVTIRRLAQDLSVTPMALYWHFKDKEGLLAACADRIWDDTAARLALEVADASADAWAPLQSLLEALLGAMRRHPALARLTPSRVVACDSGLGVTEWTLAFLADRGLERPRAAASARFVLLSAVTLIDGQPGADVVEAAERREAQRVKGVALASLPPTRYPNVVASAQYLTDCDSPDEYFATGVALIVAGVRHQTSPVGPR